FRAQPWELRSDPERVSNRSTGVSGVAPTGESTGPVPRPARPSRSGSTRIAGPPVDYSNLIPSIAVRSSKIGGALARAARETSGASRGEPPNAGFDLSFAEGTSAAIARIGRDEPPSEA